MVRWLLAAVGVSALLVGASAGDKSPEKPKRSINEIMVQAHLTPKNRSTKDNLDNKVVDGKASEAEKVKLLELYTALSEAKPRKGDLNAWKARTGEMVDAVKAVIRGEAGAADRLTKARDCKTCHELHRLPPSPVIGNPLLFDPFPSPARNPLIQLAPSPSPVGPRCNEARRRSP